VAAAGRLEAAVKEQGTGLILMAVEQRSLDSRQKGAREEQQRIWNDMDSTDLPFEQNILLDI
jgi:hypothetical protein